VGLKLYNTFTRKREEFTPRSDIVGIYTCGLTVQGPPHVGHVRAALVRDILMRWLFHLGHKVKALENFTDIDDKIIEKQKEYKQDWRIISQENIETYLWACDKLNIIRADVYPRASQHIEEIISLVQRLVDKGYAYENKGDVYFRVRKFPDYGKLSKKSIDELMAGARIEPTESKNDPLDFALWKSAKPGEPYWLSPWGKGRPGWHIECSAMSMHYLGETFDIHTGGEDLIFPHHENEIAQSVAATGKEFVRYWLHNGWVTLTGEKMSKSTGHYAPTKDVLERYSSNVIRLFMLKTHYRKQLEYADERLDEARSAYTTIQTYLDTHGDVPQISEPLMLDTFTEAMNDDLNTSRALGVLYELIKKGYENKDVNIASSVKFYFNLLGFSETSEEGEQYDEEFRKLMNILSDVRQRLQHEKKFDELDALAKDFLDRFEKIKNPQDLFVSIVNLLLNMRNRLRKEKNYAVADDIRKRLQTDLRISIDDQEVDLSTFRREVK
jgi:cysteinyl-tRNA synthetase